MKLKICAESRKKRLDKPGEKEYTCKGNDFDRGGCLYVEGSAVRDAARLLR